MDTSHFSAASSLLSKLPLGPFSNKISASSEFISSPSALPTSNGSTSTLNSKQIETSSKLASSIQEFASSPTSPLLLSTTEVSAPSGLSSTLHTTEGKRERERERRIMPARLQRVSNLLAGSTLEDELSGTNIKQEAHSLPSHTKFVLYNGDNPGLLTYETDIKPQQGSLFATPDFVKSCRTRELIETPEFKQRDDTEMMGKTRSIRSQEDTSDAAYERRHRKPDNVEKKQRRLERERLVRDRQKLKDRIDQLKVADVRLLAPILNAREQQQKQSEGGFNIQTSAIQSQAASPGGVDAATISKSNTMMDPSQTMAKLGSLRAELLEEANDTLKRYDILLATSLDTIVPLHIGKRKMGEIGQVDSPGETSKPTRSISVSGAFAKKGGTSKGLYTNKIAKRSASASDVTIPSTKMKKVKGRASQSPLDVKAKRLSAGATLPVSPQPFKPGDGPVRAENTYANIHARTSGGRFAPKSALAGATGSTSKINTKGKWKAEGKNKPPKKVKSPIPGSKGRVTSSAAAIKGSSSSSAAVALNGKPKRVKIVLSKRRRASAVDESTSSSTSLSSALDTGEEEKKEEEATVEEEMELDTTPQRAARAALTLEEAQALLAKAMEDDDDDDDDDQEVEVEIKPDDV